MNALNASKRNFLSRKFTLQEIEEALKATDSTKAPGPDGINAGVLKSMWSVIKKDIEELFQSLYQNNLIPPGLNSSFLVLIPKSKDAKSPKDYRPISLMKAAMKLITKVLARRLKEVLNDLVSDSQTASIQQRQISNNILLTSEAYSALSSNRSTG